MEGLQLREQTGVAVEVSETATAEQSSFAELFNTSVVVEVGDGRCALKKLWLRLFCPHSENTCIWSQLAEEIAQFSKSEQGGAPTSHRRSEFLDAPAGHHRIPFCCHCLGRLVWIGRDTDPSLMQRGSVHLD